MLPWKSKTQTKTTCEESRKHPEESKILLPQFWLANKKKKIFHYLLIHHYIMVSIYLVMADFLNITEILLVNKSTGNHGNGNVLAREMKI